MRLERAESSRLAWAFVLSLAFHLAVFGTYEAGKRLNLWQRWQWPAWMAPRMLSEVFKKKETAEQQRLHEQMQRRQEVPLMFVEVSPSQATAKPPDKPLYYSSRNSVAANPEASRNTSVPKIDGKQMEVVRTEEVPRTKAFPLQPSPTPPADPPVQEPEKETKPVQEQPKEAKPAKEPQEKPKPVKEPGDQAKPKPIYNPGDLAMAKPEPAAPKTEPQKPRSRPRTVEAALQRLRPEERQLFGEKSRQDGGVKRVGLQTSLDAVETPFGAYDRAIIEAVQSHWYDLLDDRTFARDRTGKVTLKFHLHSDGSVSEMNMLENTVDLTLALLCRSAINDSAPFAVWPADMKRLIGAEFREITFTFIYY